ncbi:MAG: large subunit ribosomal protein [Chloroflexota bacterium]|jgi:large subunit ribosomal protein L21|nr:large subunit ribosomal protein [Chloroflexota bacterium]MEA2654006.1 large subunit ribosomal protein [Chloroflexota bacterium]
MYAVIETGGKQYRVEVGTELEVELLDGEPGKSIIIERVLLVGDGDDSAIGRPLVADATVSAEVVSRTRGPKLISFKYRPKARSRVKKGHRQELTLLRVADITFGGKSAAKIAQKAAADAKTERQRLEEAAATQATKDAELASKLAVGAEAAEKKTVKTAADAKATKTKTETKGPVARAKAITKARTSPKTDAKAADKTDAKATKADTSKRPAAKPKGETPRNKADAPKRTRSTKKDE